MWNNLCTFFLILFGFEGKEREFWRGGKGVKMSLSFRSWDEGVGYCLYYEDKSLGEVGIPFIDQRILVFSKSLTSFSFLEFSLNIIYLC